MAMKLNTGKVAFPIEFDNGDKEVIYFNPNDPGLSVRMKDFRDIVSRRVQDMGDIGLKNDGTPTEEEGLEGIERFRSVQNILHEELDRAFGGNISEIVFKHCSPFAIVNGDYFIVQFIEAITPEIEKHVREAKGDVEKKMQKHIEKYAK